MHLAKNKLLISIFFLILFIVVLSSYFVLFKDEKKEKIDINYITTPGSANNNTIVKNKTLKTPALENIENLNYEPFYNNPNKATCAVQIESQKIVKKGQKYEWYIKAKKRNNTISFDLTDTYKDLCLNNNNCICDKNLLKTSNVCSFNPSSVETRIYIQPYFVSLPNQRECSFDLDKIPAKIKNLNNQEAYYITLPNNQEYSQEYKIELPINNPDKDNCMLASLDIVKVNNLTNSQCSVEGPKKDFILTSKNIENSEQKDNKDFYSAEAIKKTNNNYNINCYTQKNININKVGIQIYQKGELTNTQFCSINNCTKQSVLDSASSKEFIKYTIPYSFNKNGNYKIKCVNK